MNAFQEKLNDTIEKLDRLLTQQQLKNSFEQNKKLIESTKEEKSKSWWQKLFKG
ncbi:hypothetical protein [Pseudogracilibacillus sp. SO30301A]|uniref:hypothetical protein n=1 Tax=Pseudogracilibacillus sp. SO30301A TaxID=3098291 RepID=UPI00300E42DE